MKNYEFDKVINKELDYCKLLLGAKGAEYTPPDPEDMECVEEDDGQFVLGFASDDRLRHFKKAAILMGCTPKQALLGMLSKHTISVADMITSGNNYPVEKWCEKITDSINYHLLLMALVVEEAENEKH